MNTAKTRTQQKEQTRLKLIEAAGAVFARLGFDRAQISEITEAAGVAHGTFYVHFQSKDDLIHLLVDRINGRIRRDIQAIWEQPIPDRPRDALIRMAQVYLDHLWQERLLIQAFGKKYGDSLPLAWIREGVNPPLVDFVGRRFSQISSGSEGPAVDRVMIIHAILAIWTRLGFRYAADPQPNREAAVLTVVECTIGVLSRFLPELAEVLEKQNLCEVRK